MEWMMKTDQLVLTEPQAQVAPMDPMQMIQLAFQTAIERGEGLEVVDRILAQQKAMMDYKDREAFQAALRRIQDELRPIVKKGENRETSSKYATAGAIDEAIGSLLKRERMTLSFEPRPSDKADMVFVVGILSLGAYSKEYPLEMPADGKGAKGGGVMSRTHATGSAITYAKRYLKNMIFDLRFADKDDDGNAAARGENPKLIGWLKKMREARDPGELDKAYKDAYKHAEEAGDKAAMYDLIQCNRIEKGKYK